MCHLPLLLMQQYYATVITVSNCLIIILMTGRLDTHVLATITYDINAITLATC